MFTSFLRFARSILSESDGTGSSTRLCMLMLISFVIGAGTSIALKLHTPITVSDVNSFLSAAGVFIATTCGPLYLINKGADAVKHGQDVNGNTPQG